MRIREKLLFGAFALMFVCGTLWFGARVWAYNTIVVPRRGGELREAFVGSPRHINPVLTDSTGAEGALEALVFSSLFRPDTTGGLEADLVESYTISEDRREYFVTLREGITWHDGALLSADDIIFTLSLITNPSLRSPFAFAWHGVRPPERISDRTIKFTLEEPYEYFLQNLTFRILPKHLWERIPIANFHLAELNVQPIGSGPYRFRSFEKDQLGSIISYTLSANPNYYHGRPHINTILLKFYKTQEEALLALKKDEVGALGGIGAPEAATLGNHAVMRIETLRQFSVFFNTDSPILSNARVREALIASVERDAFVSSVLFDGGVAGDGASYDKARARSLLDRAGWNTLNNEGIRVRRIGRRTAPLALEMTIPLGDVHQRTAEFLAEAWRAIGVDITVSSLNPVEISNIMRSRKYDMILFGTLSGIDPDLYPFWHSSQIDYPGLNLSRLEHRRLDALLERSRRETSAEERLALSQEARELIIGAHAALFLYSPYYFYAVSPEVQFKTAPKIIGAPEERFGRVADWFIMTTRVWRR